MNTYWSGGITPCIQSQHQVDVSGQLNVLVSGEEWLGRCQSWTTHNNREKNSCLTWQLNCNCAAHSLVQGCTKLDTMLHQQQNFVGWHLIFFGPHSEIRFMLSS